MKYKVKLFMDDTYEVIEVEESEQHGIEIENETKVFQGSLSDCEAWIRLTESGYM